MFDFLKRILWRGARPSGASPAPTGSVDGPAEAHAAASELPHLDLAPATQAQVEAASAWCIDRNIELAASLGLGQHERWSFSQETGTLTLAFPDGTEQAVAGQILASFDPADKSFVWAWDNPSLRDDLTKDASRALALGESLSEPALTTGKQHATFAHAAGLVMLAAQHAGAGGVCRLKANGWSTVFVALHPNQDSIKGGCDAVAAEAHIAVVRSYETPLFEADAAYNDSGMDSEVQGGLFASKLQSYAAYWARDDDYHQPCSLSWPSDCDPSRVRTRFAVPAREGGMLVATLVEDRIVSAYRIETYGTDLKIVDNLIDFNDLYLWPS